MFLTATAALAPILQSIGGSSDGEGAPGDPSYRVEGPGPFAELTETVWSCESFGGFRGLRGNDRERACGPRKALQAARGNAARKPTRLVDGPLDQAILASIAGAGEPSAEPLLEVPPPIASLEPESLALATGRGPGSWGAPQIPVGARLPQNLLADLATTFDEPIVDPESPVVPLPGALPLMITGFAALFGAARRRRRTTGFPPTLLQG